MASPFPLQSRADCEDNFALIRAWISQCERHPTCKRTPLFAPELQLPTRLIDIGTGSEDSTPRLVISADLGETADCRYVALSHCWGDPRKVEVPKTLRKTLEEHRKSITGLNKTFQDAFEVTRQIGVRYLWIDSLCIIQDEEEDFKAECSRMSLVYAQAYCVLSALDAEDGNVGLFIPRSPLAQPSQTSPTEKRWKSMLNGPLSSRGWAFQEHQLARRIVHFTNVRILWECRVCIACEDSPSQLYRSFVSAMTGEQGIFFATYKTLRLPLGNLQLPFGLGDATAGVLALLFAKTCVFPFDLIWKQLQVQGPTRSKYVHKNIPKYKGVFKTMQDIIKTEGKRGLYRGLTVR